MYLFENPVLERELLANLRHPRAFALEFVYVTALGLVVYAAWPEAQKIDMTNPDAARRLVNLFFVGQYLAASLLTPSFAAGSITGEKERKSYEMLLASPLRPGAIVLGKLLASLIPVALLIFLSLPVVMLCLPLGGVSFYELVAAYVALLASVTTFAAVSLAASSYFSRTVASLVVSYLVILPLVLFGAWFWFQFEGGSAALRLVATLIIFPPAALAGSAALLVAVARRLVHPPDVGSEGKEVVDEEHEMRHAWGMVIQRDEFPDRLFAPPKRTDLLPDGVNPVYDKEIRSELFSQGTLMLRLVIQISMVLALPLTAACLYFQPAWAAWYVAYVILFNMLVGPVFSAGSITSERERETLDLLLVTILSPGQILWGKLLSGFRVSCVLTLFLVWPLALAWPLVDRFWPCWLTFLAYTAVVLLTSLSTSVVALCCSVLFHRTSVSTMAAYMAVAVLFLAPPAVSVFCYHLVPSPPAFTHWVDPAALPSPFLAVFSLPLDVQENIRGAEPGRWDVFARFTLAYALLDLGLLLAMNRLFERRWRVSG